MKYLSIFILLLSLFYACQDADWTYDQASILNTLPDCIQSEVNDPDRRNQIRAVRSTQLYGTTHYWLVDDAQHADGISYIVDEGCNVLCYFCGECIQPPCQLQYTSGWALIWER